MESNPSGSWSREASMVPPERPVNQDTKPILKTTVRDNRKSFRHLLQWVHHLVQNTRATVQSGEESYWSPPDQYKRRNISGTSRPSTKVMEPTDQSREDAKKPGYTIEKHIFKCDCGALFSGRNRFLYHRWFDHYFNFFHTRSHDTMYCPECMKMVHTDIFSAHLLAFHCHDLKQKSSVLLPVKCEYCPEGFEDFDEFLIHTKSHFSFDHLKATKTGDTNQVAGASETHQQLPRRDSCDKVTFDANQVRDRRRIEEQQPGKSVELIDTNRPQLQLRFSSTAQKASQPEELTPPPRHSDKGYTPSCSILENLKLLKGEGKCHVNQQQDQMEAAACNTTIEESSAAELLYPITEGHPVKKEVVMANTLGGHFGESQSPCLQLSSILGRVVELCHDYHGSRLIQRKLNRASFQEIEFVLQEVLSACRSIATNVFGNYVIQHLFELGTRDQISRTIEELLPHIQSLALHKHGSHVIQKALEYASPEDQFTILRELEGNILVCSKNQYGSHVIRKCIMVLEPSKLQSILNAILGQAYNLSTHLYGHHVIQYILEFSNDKQLTQMLEEIKPHTEQLIKDQFGNYVAQRILDHGRPMDKSRIISEVCGGMLQLSQHKHACGVVEKCVRIATKDERNCLVKKICMTDPRTSQPPFDKMIKDQRALAVVLAMVDTAEIMSNHQRKILSRKLQSHAPTLRKLKNGDLIIAKAKKLWKA